MTAHHKWTNEEKDFLRGYVSVHTWSEATEEFNRRYACDLSEEAVRAAGKRFEIKTGRTGRFEKGNIPANKGTHPKTVGRMAETQFKKGRMPKNHLPVGSVRVRRSYKGKKPYVWEKVAEPNQWRMKHVLEWERYNGPVPKGKIVVFADGDTLNTDISNLILVSRSQHAVMNRWGIKGCDKDHAEVAANIANLKIQISKAKKERKKKNE